jgi:hypothetical protein
MIRPKVKPKISITQLLTQGFSLGIRKRRMPGLSQRSCSTLEDHRRRKTSYMLMAKADFASAGGPKAEALGCYDFGMLVLGKVFSSLSYVT